MRKIGFAGMLLLCMFLATSVRADDSKNISIKEFVSLASQNDTEFDLILIDNLTLAYSRTLGLPSADIIFDVKAQYDFFISPDKNDPAVSMGLSKLFPFHATQLNAQYSNTPTAMSDDSSSDITFTISQPIAQNAFGRATKMRDKIIGLENDIARYQIVEAYEDYLASLMSLYYNWYSAWENLQIGKASYRTNLKLLDNIHEREKNKIALPVDVNKVELLVLEKKETMLSLQESYEKYTNLIAKAIRADSGTMLTPLAPDVSSPKAQFDFNAEYLLFKKQSRTYSVLSMLENKSSVSVEEAADALLPSTNLFAGYSRSGQDWGIEEADDFVFAGISLEWPMNNSVKKARHETEKIKDSKTVLSSNNKKTELKTTLQNLYLSIEHEKELITIAQTKIELSEKILDDESQNYSLGKITLNDYISAVTQLDSNRFNKITHLVRLGKYLIEWRRLTDNLVKEDVIDNTTIK